LTARLLFDTFTPFDEMRHVHSCDVPDLGAWRRLHPMLTPISSDLVEPRRFKALHGEWPPEELGHFFWLTPDDLVQVRACRGAANRLGFALNLLLRRFLHCSLPSLDCVPERVVQFVAMQLNTHPGVLVEYGARRKQTRDEHLVQIRAYLGMRLYVHERDDQRLGVYLLSRALERDDPAVLLEEAEDWLRDEGILFPAESTLQKLIAQARPQADAQLFVAITGQLNPFQSLPWMNCFSARKASAAQRWPGSRRPQCLPPHPR
jgi:hypothetical protein